MQKEVLEQLISQIVTELLKQDTDCKNADGVISVPVPQIKVNEADRMDTGKVGDKVYTKDLFSLQESPRLGCGIMDL